jgi:putative membrane protein
LARAKYLNACYVAAVNTAPAPATELASGRFPLAMLATAAVVLLWSAIHPYDYFTWFLEVWPGVLGAAILIATYRRFRFTDLLYALMCLHAAVLFVGGHYTYARVPAFNWVRDALHLMRNDYDRVGHFLQGFVPALVMREVFVRKGIVRGRGWRAAIIILACLGISALYELLEWRVAVATGTAATDFLGTQGDPWDTQEDMATALVGAILALLAMSRLHDRAMSRLARRTGEQVLSR